MNETLCIIGALNEEIVEIRRRMAVEDSERFGSAHVFTGVWQGRCIVLVRSGIGQERAHTALTRVCERFVVSHVVSIGYAGGLVPGLGIGDIVIADKVLELDSAASNSRETTEYLAERAMQVDISPAVKRRRGGLLTVDKAALTPPEKQALGSRYGVLAVDMETAALLKLADEKRLPFLSLRSITDTVDHELIDFSSCYDEAGSVSKVKAGWYVLTHPEIISKIRALRDSSRKATQNLTQLLEKLLTSSW